MRGRTLNLGILAHVDAGKTTLTERLLYAAGAVDRPGRVDAGTTRTDTLELERRRGITIRSAVASFRIGDVSVNLIDTPGHPDFIAEVERVLGVLDGAVLLVSAVEGVQPQTRVLYRALRRLRVPTLLFVNKIDRRGAGDDVVLSAIAARLTTATVPMVRVERLGTRAARVVAAHAADPAFTTRLTEVLADADDEVLAAVVDSADGLPYPRLRAELAAQTARARVHPVFFGSAATGAGVEPLMAGLVELLPAAGGDPDGPPSGTVFKIERGAAGGKVAYVRMFSGTVRTRERIGPQSGAGDKVTAIEVAEQGAWVPRPRVRAGEVGRVWGLDAVRIGDPVGVPPPAALRHRFGPPTLESAVVARDPRDGAALRLALAQLAEQDPLINVRLDGTGGEVRVSLYGEVQMEVLRDTLAAGYGIGVVFQPATTVCVERPVRTGEAVERLNAASNPFRATVGLRIDPAAPGSGVEFRLRVEPYRVPLHIYRSVGAFDQAMRRYVGQALTEGRYGWEVTDCVVTMVECAYSVADGPPSTRGPDSTAADFRKLTPQVVAAALERAGTVVCEPVVRASLEVPTAALGQVLVELARLGAGATGHSPHGEMTTLQTQLPAARLPRVQRLLPGLTGGEGVLESEVVGYEPVRGDPPRRGGSPAPAPGG